MHDGGAFLENSSLLSSMESVGERKRENYSWKLLMGARDEYCCVKGDQGEGGFL